MKSQAIESVFHFCPRCGVESDDVGSIPFRCHQCGFAHFFGPVAAVGALVTNEEDKLLLVRRAKNPGKGRWGLPGGFVDRGEKVEEALAREVREEIGLTLTHCSLLMTHPNEYNYAGVVAPVIDLFYRAEVESPFEIKLVDGELDHFEWVRPTKKHLAKMAFPSNRLAIEHWMSNPRD